ncbi:MAG: co-chaperone DjlA [Halofilum sp. (in: g-proteobacteria)]|nr:co-chaperone DjlA [Halofilum sp. (in: g-proteobacteria)]
MSWWGKVVGGAFGFMVGGPLGALLGAALGHSFDRGLHGIPGAGGAARQERVQAAFFTATFSVMGHLAKADGRVSANEIGLAEAVMRQMNLNAEQRRAAIRLFNQGKAADFDLDGVVRQLRSECGRNTNLVQMFVEIQLQAAYADGRMDAPEERLMLHMCELLGFPEERFRLLERMLLGEHRAHRQRGAGPPADQGLSLDDAYAILGVSRDASNDEVKKAYRRLMSQHHPDKLVSKGLPDEMIQMAKTKSQDISRAYEAIKNSRGI